MNFDNQGIRGFDVSLYQDDNETAKQIDFKKMKDWGADFVIPKAGQYNYADPDFPYNWRESQKAGIPRAGYWFCDKRDKGKKQAGLYWNLVKHDLPEGFLAADFEHGSWTGWQELYNFLSEIQQLSGFPSDRLPVYTGYPYWTQFCPRQESQLEWFAQFPLWLAWYTADPRHVKVPKPWSEVLLWQNGTPAIGLEVGAESKEIDHNVFNGDWDKFVKYFGAQTSPETPVPDAFVYAEMKFKSDGSVSGSWKESQ